MCARDGVGSLSYRMLDCPDKVVIAQVDDKGFLLSGSLTGTSSLLITSQETFGVSQTVILTVKVSRRTAAWKVFVALLDSEINLNDLVVLLSVCVCLMILVKTTHFNSNKLIITSRDGSGNHS